MRAFQFSLLCWLLTLLRLCPLQAKAVPNPGENLASLVTFGAQADKSWGDDDFTQTFFFLIPKGNRQPVYIRVFDPDCGSQFDEKRFTWNTTTEFSLYGGVGSDAHATEPKGNFRSGTLLKQVKFGVDSKYDGKWCTFGPLNPLEGELVPEFEGYVFKLIAQGKSGDDGNLYRYFLSTSPTENVAVEGGNAFTYEYAFRLVPQRRAVTHLYPFVNDRVVSVRQSNFDLDGDVSIKIFSVAKNGHSAAVSQDNVWARNMRLTSLRKATTWFSTSPTNMMWPCPSSPFRLAAHPVTAMMLM